MTDTYWTPILPGHVNPSSGDTLKNAQDTLKTLAKQIGGVNKIRDFNENLGKSYFLCGK